ncbi:MAG: hypothetical protein ACK55S_11790 [Planctomycetota bacterium]
MKMATGFRRDQTHRGNSRRGVTLLMVVSIIVLFLLMGAAFLVVATQFRRSATVLSHVRERRDDAPTLVKRAFQDLLREPSLENVRSPLRGHSLLGDLYGYGFTRTGVPVAALVNQGQGIWSITLQAPYDQLRSDLDGGLTTPFPDNGSFNGRYLSLTDLYDANGVRLGKHLGLTGFILDYQVLPPSPPGGNRYRFFVRFGWDDAQFLPAATFTTFDLHINGRPFTGSGAGLYSPPTGAVTNFRRPALSEEAFKPNRATPDPVVSRTTGETRTQLWRNYLGIASGASVAPNIRSTNEDYDAVDYQNMHLSIVRYQGGVPLVTPSFYRPQLVRYWGQSGSYNVNSSLGQVPYSFHADRQSDVGGPLYVDANRNGVPDFNEQAGSVVWDVDNDGDGINDSIWMDIDLPIQTDIKGKVYKPLVAYHVLDMDGRLNLNFHGNQYQREIDLTTNAPVNLLNPATDATARRLSLHGFYNDGDNNLADDGLLHPTGFGIGTGEISLNYALGRDNSGRRISEKLFFGADGVIGRYGSDNQIPPAGAIGSNNAPGAIGLVDFKSRSRFQNYPFASFVGNAGLVNDQLYRSPLDIHGRFELGVPNVTFNVRQDPYNTASSPVSIAPGMPIVNAVASGLVNELVDSVYEMDASQAPFTPRLGFAPNLVSSPPNDRGLDANYSPHELESVLRAFDFDSRQLPPRLRNFLPDLFSGTNSQLRHLLTTDSWELPVAPQLISDLFRERWGRTPTADDLPAELFLGRKLNLNKRVDNPANPAVPLADPLLPRHLFNLTLLVCPETIDYDYNADGARNANDQLSFRRDLAQWCVNVKDFMDPDCVNTQFAFDLTPEDGWTPNVTIWGCERPELLLTESFALHDKRLQDLDTEQNGGTLNDSDPAKRDTDLDSLYVPNASAFIELYNPWVNSANSDTATNSDLPPAEIYNPARSGVNLQKVNGESPVWRLRILNSSTNTNANIDEQNITDDNANVVKIVYFARPGNGFLTARHAGNPDVVFFPPVGLAGVPALQPGRRAIIGSAGVAQSNLYTTYVGRLSPSAGPWNAPGALDRTRRIVLDPLGSRVSTYYWDNSAAAMREQVANNVVCLPIGEQYTTGGSGSKPRNFGLTDPKRGYDVEAAALNPTYILNPVADGFEFFDSGMMTAVTLDAPADKQFQSARWASIPTLPTLPSGGLRDEGKILSCFSVHLQRLADPTQPFDAVNNPYLTVDYIGSDVSIINGIYSGDDPDRQNTLDDDLASFERGRFHQRLGGNRKRLLWKGTQDGSLTVGAPRVATGDQHVVSLDVIQSFGEVDLIYRNTDPSYLSNDAFPWLTWNNRPYVSQFELQNVPYTPQALLTSRFDLPPPSPDNPYSGQSSRATAGPDATFPHAADRCNHLFNFYADSVTCGATALRQGPPALHRLFDYIHVESQFAGATERIPGKINLNTISDERVWLGLMQRYGETNTPQNPYGTVTWLQFDQSRRGDPALAASMPTEIPNLFRNADAVHRVPVPKLLTRTSSATLFRSTNYSGIGTAPSSPPLFELKTNPGDWANPDRNAYFRYDIRQRLGNLVTTRSNVYAVWVTIGFFEVDPATGKPVNEIGQEEGTVQRHRGFFLVDRSIPVAFEPGRDHDVQNCVLVESIIQREVTSQK